MTWQFMDGKQYRERNPMALDKAGNYYCRHVEAMTAESLHDKSDIAAELAVRDMEIDRLRRELAKAFEAGYGQ
ncbi:hypothetical protein SYK_02460 [Pseudodesulfovibrio nedwellii]|uniref:Uncharacterized protein n=1 Tax=Pseudodesulfovibrio nedwellii TaxID=2973072 RepID=A0ABN6S2G5_9BACT|nr:hypothetical protein [Pseudodesulfovibrio nedwellii]BDQ35886.1 hypothetical protein SYK_02460 [Pseudodesulfovibrio nedwellii]